jgi:hypothetical protein
MRIITSSPLPAGKGGSSAQVRSNERDSIAKAGTTNNGRGDKKRHLEMDEDALSEACSDNDGREGPSAMNLPPNSSRKLEKKLQDYVAEDAEKDTSPSSVSSSVFTSGKSFWMKFLDESQSQASEDTEGQRKTPMGREIRHTWSSGSPLSECSAFDDGEDLSPRSLVSASSKPAEPAEAASLIQANGRENRVDQASRNDENSGHRRGSTGGLRDQPSPLMIPRRSVLTPESARMTPTGRYFGDVTNRIDHSSPSPAPNSQTKSKSKVSELAENFRKEPISGKKGALPSSQVLASSGGTGSKVDMEKNTANPTCLKVMTSSTPIPNNSNARLADSPLPDPVFEMGGMLQTPNSQSSLISETYVSPQPSQLDNSKHVNDAGKQQGLRSVQTITAPGIQPVVSVFSASVPTPTQVHSEDKEAGDSSQPNPKRQELCPPASQDFAGEKPSQKQRLMPIPTKVSTLTNTIESRDEVIQNDPAPAGDESKHTRILTDSGSGECLQEQNIQSSSLVRSDKSEFNQLLRKWRDKSDDKPNAHFLSPEQDSRSAARQANVGFSPQVSRLRLEDDRNRSNIQAETPLVTKRIQTYSKDHFDLVRENLDSECQERKTLEHSDPSSNKRSKFQRCDEADSPPEVPKVNALQENSQLICQPTSSFITRQERVVSSDDTSQAIVILKSKDSVKVLVGEAQTDASEQMVVRNMEMVTSTEQENYAGESPPCECSRSVFSGNDDLISFFLPQMGMACTCGRQTRRFVYPDDPTAIENILRPWQIEFLKSFGIHRGDQLVKARHRSANLLSKALRQWRKKKGMVPFKTSACGMAIHIWAKTCKAFVRSIRKHDTAGSLILDQQPADLVQEFSNFLGALPAAPERQAEGLILAIEPGSQVEV